VNTDIVQDLYRSEQLLINFCLAFRGSSIGTKILVRVSWVQITSISLKYCFHASFVLHDFHADAAALEAA